MNNVPAAGFEFTDLTPARGNAADRADALRGKSILIAGLGNIGSSLAQLLANQNIRLARLIDRDDVEPRNAWNQIYDPARDAGRAKVSVVAERLQALDPSLVIEPIKVDLAAAPLGLFEGIDVCLGCLDSLLARQILANGRAWPLGVPVIDGAVDGSGELIGRIQTIVPGSACLECSWRPSHYRAVGSETPNPIGRCKFLPPWPRDPSAKPLPN